MLIWPLLNHFFSHYSLWWSKSSGAVSPEARIPCCWSRLAEHHHASSPPPSSCWERGFQPPTCPQLQNHVLPSPKPVSPRPAGAAHPEVLQEVELLNAVLFPLGLGTLLGAQGESLGALLEWWLLSAMWKLWWHLLLGFLVFDKTGMGCCLLQLTERCVLSTAGISWSLPRGRWRSVLALGDACMLDSKLQGKPCLFPTSVKSPPALSNTLKDWNLSLVAQGMAVLVMERGEEPCVSWRGALLSSLCHSYASSRPIVVLGCRTAGWDVPAQAQTRGLQRQSESSGSLCTALLCMSAPMQGPWDVAGEA